MSLNTLEQHAQAHIVQFILFKKIFFKYLSNLNFLLNTQEVTLDYFYTKYFMSKIIFSLSPSLQGLRQWSVMACTSTYSL